MKERLVTVGGTFQNYRWNPFLKRWEFWNEWNTCWEKSFWLAEESIGAVLKCWDEYDGEYIPFREFSFAETWCEPIKEDVL